MPWRANPASAPKASNDQINSTKSAHATEREQLRAPSAKVATAPKNEAILKQRDGKVKGLAIRALMT